MPRVSGTDTMYAYIKWMCGESNVMAFFPCTVEVFFDKCERFKRVPVMKDYDYKKRC